MPWPSRQMRAIAARMIREGKSREEVARFFREHGHGDTKTDTKKRPKGKS